MSVRGPVIAPKGWLEKLCGQTLPEEVFEFAPWGHRVVVIREEPIKVTEGGIYIPDTAQALLSVGWVVSCGPDVGQPKPDYPGVCPFRYDLLPGAKVLFGAFAGSALLMGTRGENTYESSLVLMNDGDIWGTVGPLPEDPPTN